MSKHPRATAASRPSAWAQALFAGSLLFAGLSVWLLITL